MKSVKLGDVVEVIWTDSLGDGGWMDAEDVVTECGPIRSVGYLFFDGPHAVTVIQSDHDNGERVDNYITIPKVVIKSVRKLG